MARGGQRGFEVFTARADARERGDPVVFGQVRCHMEVRAGAYYKAVGSAELAFGFADQQPWSADCAARLVIGRTWYPAAVWHAGKAADAESVDGEYLACVRLAGQRVVVEVGPG